MKKLTKLKDFENKELETKSMDALRGGGPIGGHIKCRYVEKLYLSPGGGIVYRQDVLTDTSAE